MPTTRHTAKYQMIKSTRLLSSLLRKSLLLLGVLVVCVVGLLAAGLVAFTGFVLLAQDRPPVQSADAIVVVTGGAGRLEHGVRLFQDGMGKKLLISGVHPDYSSKTLLTNSDLTIDEIDCCVELDAQPLNTVANATQTALWARQNHFRSLIIVTSAYHMPRTLLEMRRAAPDIDFQTQLVTPTADRSFFSRLFDHNNAILLTKEYGKLLAAILHGTSERLKGGKPVSS